MVDLPSPPVRTAYMARRESVALHVVVHEPRQVRLLEDVLKPLPEREVVDAAALCRAVGQVTCLVALWAPRPVYIPVLCALQLGVRRVPVRNAHVDADWNRFERLQVMAFQDGHHFFESRHFVVFGEQGASVLPDIFG